jgi:hypothetical protein
LSCAISNIKWKRFLAYFDSDIAALEQDKRVGVARVGADQHRESTGKQFLNDVIAWLQRDHFGR